jgi:WD40 repeat protein
MAEPPSGSDDTQTASGIGDDATLDGRDGARPDVGDSRYQIEGEVGRGGLGVVLRAIDRKLGRPIALKMLKVIGGRAGVDRFEHEARITARLEHPSIVPVYDAGRLDGALPFYAMKLSNGRTLAAAIDDAHDLSARLGLLGSVLAVADAIAFAHSRGVIHRDLKPSNILVGGFGETLVIDWGLAKQVGEPDDGAAARGSELDGADLTEEGAVLGTPAYMAPEQARGEPVDFRADVYALGAMLYHVLAGVPPREGSRADVIAASRGEPMVPIEQRAPGVPRDLAAICARALAIDPAARYPTAGELAEDLRRFQTGQLVAARAYTWAQRFGRWIRRHRAVVALATASGIAVAVIGTIAVLRIVDARERATASAVEADAARAVAEAQSTRLMLGQARAMLEVDPSLALAWLKRVVASPAFDAVDREEVRVLIADARSRGVIRHSLPGAIDIIAVEGTPDGRFALGRSNAGTVVIWDVEAGRVHATVHGPFREIALAPDGASFAAVDARGVSIRDLDGRELRRRDLPGVRYAAFGATGELIVVGDDGAVQTPDGQRLAIDARIELARALPDGRIAFAGDGFAGWWDPASGRTARAAIDTVSLRLWVAPDGQQIAVAGGRGTFLLDVDVDALRVREQDEIGSIAFGPGDLLAWSNRNGVTIRDRRSGARVALVAPKNSYVAFAGARLVAANFDTRLAVIDDLAMMPSRLWRRSGYVRFVRGLDGERVAYFTSTGEVGVVDPAAPEPDVLAVDGRYYSDETVALGTGGGRIIFGSAGAWSADPASRAVHQLWDKQLACAAELPSGKVALISAHGELSVYGSPPATPLSTALGPTAAVDCVGRPDGTLGVAFNAAVVAVVDADTGAELARHDGAADAASYSSVASTPDGTLILPDYVGVVRAWRPGEPLRVLYRHEGPAWSASVSADGRLIATSSRDRTVRIATPEGKVVQILRSPGDELSNVVLSPAGTAVTASSMDGSIVRWEIDPARAPPDTRAELAAHLASLTSVELGDEP